MKRERLTITLRNTLIKQIDQKIDGVKIRNRSHAIEYLLTKSIGSSISKAFILAGGHGLKMRPFTYEMPKCMITVHNKPILEHIIILLRENNIKDIYLGIDYLGEKIVDYFGDGSRLGVKITYVKNKKPLGTAGALKSAELYLKKDIFLLLHGDILANIDLLDMIEFADEEQGIVTMAVTSVDDPSHYGAVRSRGAKIVEFSEKPAINYWTSRLINAGIYIIKPEIFNCIPKKTICSLEKDVFPKLIDRGEIVSYQFAGQWFDITTPKTYTRAVKEWKK